MKDIREVVRIGLRTVSALQAGGRRLVRWVWGGKRTFITEFIRLPSGQQSPAGILIVVKKFLRAQTPQVLIFGEQLRAATDQLNGGSVHLRLSQMETISDFRLGHSDKIHVGIATESSLHEDLKCQRWVKSVKWIRYHSCLSPLYISNEMTSEGKGRVAGSGVPYPVEHRKWA